MIFVCIVLTVTNVAAFWAWRLAEVSLENARRNGHAEFLRANKAAKEYTSFMGELMVCRKDLDYVKASWDKSSSEYAKEIEKLSDELNLLKINRVNENNMHDAEVKELRTRFDLDLTKLHQSRDEITRRLSRLNDINIDLQNEIDGLNVDKLYLKGKLAEFEAKQAKRREQKNAGMRRFRAKKKEAKG